MKRFATAAALAIGLSLALPGCDASFGTTRIGDISAQAATFEGKEVKLRGTASQLVKIPLTDLKAYRLKDASGEILVLTQGEMPREGEDLVVRGKVENLLIVAGQSYGLAVKESERKAPGIRLPWQ